MGRGFTTNSAERL